MCCIAATHRMTPPPPPLPMILAATRNHWAPHTPTQTQTHTPQQQTQGPPPTPSTRVCETPRFRNLYLLDIEIPFRSLVCGGAIPRSLFPLRLRILRGSRLLKRGGGGFSHQTSFSCCYEKRTVRHRTAPAHKKSNSPTEEQGEDRIIRRLSCVNMSTDDTEEEARRGGGGLIQQT
jgi:hypothetical protein